MKQSKNLRLIPTDKPSRLYSYKSNLFLATESHLNVPSMEYQHIYITSDEEIKEGDWFITKGEVFKCTLVNEFIWRNNFDKFPSMKIDCKKIILTTDQDLIKDGVQAIDDEFLKWFVKNPSCEEVEVKPLMAGFVDDEPSYYENMYEIIIPKEETLEEALTAEEFFRNKIKENIEWEGEITLWKVPLNAELSMRWAKEYSDYVIKWQQEQMYSEEEVLDILREHTAEIFKGSKLTLTEWFEQFKKK